MMPLFSVFIASLIGGSHCIGMCGGIVLLYSQESERRFLSHLTYNLGRLSSYIFLGALAGLLGKTVNLAATASGIGKVASIVFGIFMILWGLTLLIKKTVPEPALLGSSKIAKMYHSIGKNEVPLSGPLRAYLLGLLSTLLPCGWLYMFAAVAAASGDILSGMLIMAVFWLGTVPYLASIGLASQYLLGPLRRYVPTITAILVIAAGIFSIMQHIDSYEMVPVLQGEKVEGHHHHHH